MPSRQSNQFNSLYNSIKNNTGSSTVPQDMRSMYTDIIMQDLEMSKQLLKKFTPLEESIYLVFVSTPGGLEPVGAVEIIPEDKETGTEEPKDMNQPSKEIETTPEFEILDEYTEFQMTLDPVDYDYVEMNACIIDEVEEGYERLAQKTGIKNEDLQSIRVDNSKPKTLIVGCYKGAKVPTNNKNIIKINS